MTKAVRGAIQVTEDTADAIGEATVRLVREILRANAIAENHIVSIIFSLTQDLTALNPATGLRRAGFASTPLFCAQEAHVAGGMPRVVRALLTWESLERRETVPVYLDGAEALRSDLVHGDGQ
jgi:chorismate mutase